MSLSVEWLLIHGMMQGGPCELSKVTRAGIEAKYLGEYGSDTYKTFSYLMGFLGKSRMPNRHEIITAIDVEVPDWDLECDTEIYAESIRKTHLRESIYSGLEGIASKAEKDPDKSRELLQELFLDTARDRRAEEVRTNNPDTMALIKSRYDLVKDRRRSGEIVGLSSPWPSWDKRSKGFQKGQITTILAKTGVGKTHLSLVQAVHSWDNSLGLGECVLFFSLETVRETLLDRIAAISLGLDYERLTSGYLTEIEEKKLKEFCEKYADRDSMRPEIIFFGDEVRSVKDIMLRCKELQPRLVVIDGVYLLNSHEHRKARWERVTEAIEGLRKVAVGCDVPVIITSQFKKEAKSTSRSSSREAAKYASAIFDTSSVVLGVFGGADDDGPSDLRTIICLKANEFKIPFGFRIKFNMANADFSELESFEDVESLSGTGEEIDV